MESANTVREVTKAFLEYLLINPDLLRQVDEDFGDVEIEQELETMREERVSSPEGRSFQLSTTQHIEWDQENNLVIDVEGNLHLTITRLHLVIGSLLMAALGALLNAAILKLF